MLSAASLKPRPDPDGESAPFWAAAQEGRLVVQQCADCKQTRLPATTYCPKCQSPNSTWIQCTGLGEVFSWIVVHHPIPKEAYAKDVPYVVALVTLDEGPRIVSNIIDCAPSKIEAAMRVKVKFEKQDDLLMPKFVPA